MNPVNVYEVVVSFRHLASTTAPYNGTELVIQSTTGERPKFVARSEYFSFVTDDSELQTRDIDAAAFVTNLRAARLVASRKKDVTVALRTGRLYSTTDTELFRTGARGVALKADTTSDAAKFIVAYLETGDESALLALSDYLEEKLGLSIAPGGVLADVQLRRNIDAAVVAVTNEERARAARPVTSPRYARAERRAWGR